MIDTLQRGEQYVESFENVTVLFSDVVSYTNMASKLQPIDVVGILNEMYQAFDDLVDEYECYKVETIGDAFMAVCGIRGEDPSTAASRAAGLALAMLSRTSSLMATGDQPLQIRIGLHSGPVVGAVLGSKMPHFCLCGDTVNTASRMESNSAPMRCHVSAATAELLELSCTSYSLPPEPSSRTPSGTPRAHHPTLPCGGCYPKPTRGGPAAARGPLPLEDQAPEGATRFVLEPRGAVDIKGKGLMSTFWLMGRPRGTGSDASGAPGLGRSRSPLSAVSRSRSGQAQVEIETALGRGSRGQVGQDSAGMGRHKSGSSVGLEMSYSGGRNCIRASGSWKERPGDPGRARRTPDVDLRIFQTGSGRSKGGSTTRA